MATDYSDGQFFHYTYDPMGNRLTQVTQDGTNTYTYDEANRLTSVDDVPYTWDEAGNLLSDGENTYSYDSANRLTTVNGPSSTVGYTYSGLGDRLQQTVDGVPITYTLDLNAGLTQVLSDGTYTYLYGLGRIAEVNAATEYFLGDTLGSVRQLADANGKIAFSQDYQPYGEALASEGDSASAYGFTGEMSDPSGLMYLRARYYDPDEGRFINRDTWEGDAYQPMSYNSWVYVYSNPINFTDPSGHVPGARTSRR